MAIAILDGKYEIQRELEADSNAPTYLAADPRGHHRLVKFVRNPDRFFEEMARLYACDGIQGVCRLSYNYPPFVVSGQTALMEGDICRMFATEPCTDLEDKEALATSSMARIGALVLEFVPGLPLGDVLREVDDEEKLERMALLAATLAKMHGREESHGSLCDDHVLLDITTGRVTLVGLGSDPGTGPAQDVKDFAETYLAMLDQPSPSMRSLMTRCSHPNHKRRPSMKVIYRGLIQDLNNETQPWYTRQAKPMAMAALLFTILSLGLFYQPERQEKFTFADNTQITLVETNLPLDVTRTSIGGFCDLLGPLIKPRLSFLSNLGAQELPPFRIEDDNWEKLFSELGLKYETEKTDNGQEVIRIIGYEPPALPGV